MRQMSERLDRLMRERFGAEFGLPDDFFEMPRAMRLPPPLPLPRLAPQPSGGNPEVPRLGVRLGKPSDALVEQLDLPNDQGLVLEEVGPNSPAAKAGWRRFDILLELDGKAVPRDLAAFRKQVNTLAANTPVEAVVMRKGLKQTIKGLQLPEAKPEVVERVAPAPAPLPRLQVPFDMPLRFPDGEGVFNTSMTRIVQNGDTFTAEQRVDGVRYQVQGKRTADGPVLEKVEIQRDGKSSSYENLMEVPETDRPRVEKLLRSIR
jgi:hypothetical protein